MKALCRSLILVFVCTLSLSALAQGKHVKWMARLEPSDARAGEAAQLVVTAQIEDTWHIYGLTVKDIGVATSFTLGTGSPILPGGSAVAPKGETKNDETLKLSYEQFSGQVAFGLPVKLAGTAKGQVKASLTIKFQSCDSSVCLPPETVVLAIAAKVAPGPVRPNRTKPIITVPKQPAASHASTGPPPDSAVVASVPSKGTGSGPTPGGATTANQIDEALKGGLVPFLWLSFLAGLTALLTPCVFPMIPITVTYFTKRKQAEGRKALRGPLAYCFGIISTWTGLGLLFSLLFGATRIQLFAANPYVNLGLAILFVVLAANLFGAFEIQLPHQLVNKANTGAGSGGVAGPYFMGLTFTLTSFTCTVPFVGTLLVTASRGGIVYPLIGMLAFSTAFALPFFLLAVFPQYISRMPKAGSWLVSVKAFMGFVEIAAAMKFLSNADLVWRWGILTRPVFLAAWAALALIAGGYLLGWLRLPHDAEGIKIGIPRRLMAFASVACAGLLFASMNGTSLGMLEAFPPPDPYPSDGGAAPKPGKVPWVNGLAVAMEQAKRDNKLVFVNFTGYTCVNCREMEANVLPHPAVLKELMNYVPVELFTDGTSDKERANQELLVKLANTAANPVYLIMTPEGKVVNFLEGRHPVGRFSAFLKDAANSAKLMNPGNATAGL